MVCTYMIKFVENDYKVLVSGKSCMISYLDGNLLTEARLEDGFYVIRTSTEESFISELKEIIDFRLFHQRLEHLNTESVLFNAHQFDFRLHQSQLQNCYHSCSRRN